MHESCSLYLVMQWYHFEPTPTTGVCSCCVSMKCLGALISIPDDLIQGTDRSNHYQRRCDKRAPGSVWEGACSYNLSHDQLSSVDQQYTSCDPYKARLG